jgi:hypothetical protein
MIGMSGGGPTAAMPSRQQPMPAAKPQIQITLHVLDDLGLGARAVVR